MYSRSHHGWDQQIRYRPSFKQPSGGASPISGLRLSFSHAFNNLTLSCEISLELMGLEDVPS